mmetsp:Transcript_77181/g.239819  ORF Transcript_77181/g.239819 Transcript_77181/m.239819 type:complete len:382 (-) Transcript_77181:151-1296(-)
MAHIVGGIDVRIRHHLAAVGLQGLNAAVHLVALGRQEFAIEVASGIDVRRADKVAQHHARRGVDREERRHELLAGDGVSAILHGKALEVEVTARQHSQRLPIIPSRVRSGIRHLDVRAVLPPDHIVGVMEQDHTLALGRRVCLKGRLAMAEGEGFLDLHAVQVQRVVPGVGRVAEAIVRSANELAGHLLACGRVVVGLYVREAHARHVVPWAELLITPCGAVAGLRARLRTSPGLLRAARMALQGRRDVAVGIVEQADKVVRGHHARGCADHGVFRLENCIVEAHDHPARVGHLLEVRRFGGRQAKLVRGGEVCVRACHHAPIIQNNELLGGPLGESGGGERVAVHIEGIADSVVVENAALAEDMVSVLHRQVNDADAVVR